MLAGVSTKLRSALGYGIGAANTFLAGMTMNLLDWKLKKIWPTPLLIELLRDCKSASTPVFDSCLPAVAKVYGTSLLHFKKRDRRRKGKHWEWRTARNLYALLWAWRAQAMALHDMGQMPGWRTWMMVNCQPAGGRWVADRYEAGITGKHCDTYGCPWCYMRRCAQLSSILSKVLQFDGPLSILRFQSTVQDLFKIKAERQALTKFVQTQVRDGGEFRTALRISTPWARMHEGKLVLGHSTAYIHAGAYTQEEVGITRVEREGLGTVRIRRYTGLKRHLAIMESFLFSVDALANENAFGYCLQLRAQQGARVFGIHGKPASQPASSLAEAVGSERE